MNIVKIEIPAYVFDTRHNPFAFNSDKKLLVDPIARQIEEVLFDNFGTTGCLVRGIQSGRHTNTSRRQLIKVISKNGHDIYSHEDEQDAVIHAAPLMPGIVGKILEGFHVYKPKCEERPQYPVDIWMVFQKDAYENIEYMHPRHHVITRDRWKQKPGNDNGLEGILIVN